LDGEPNKQHFAGKAAKEMQEETLLDIKSSELFDLSHMAYGDKYKGMYPSAGGCDEVCLRSHCHLHLFVHIVPLRRLYT
jgi:ADP-sugar diphosphatase